MADYDLGTARGRVEIDASGVGRGLSDANRELDQFQGKAKSSGTQMIVAGASMVGAATTIAGGFAVAINAAASFEERLSAIKAVSGATSEEMDALSDKALQLGADTKYSASESASAMEELVKAGLSVEDVLNGAADATVNLAAAGEVDLVTAATIASNAMNAFGLSAEEMPKVADLIAGAANASAIDVNEFGMAMSQSAAVANLAGMSFDDLSVAIAAMGNAGIKGSDAGTSLKTFLSNLQPVTEKQIGLFKELGIVTEDGTNRFYDAAGSLRPLNEIAGVLSTSLEGMTDAQKQMALETMFGSDAIRAAAVIADTGAEGFDTLAASMGQVSAADVAATRMDNLKGSIEQLKGSAETLLIIIGRPLADALRVWVDRITDVVNWISQLDEDTLGMIVTVGKMASAFLGSVGSLLVLYGGLQKMRAGMAALNLVVRANPMGAFLTLLIGVAAALYALYTSNESFRNAVDRLFATLKATVMPIIEQVVLGFQAMVSAFNGDGITSDGIVGKFEQIGVIARQVFDMVSAFVTDTLIPAFQDFASFITGTVVPAIQDFADFFVNEVIPVVIDVAEKIAWLASEIVERLSSAFNWLESNVFPVIVALAELVVAVGERVGQAIGLMGDTVSALGPVWRILGTVIQTAIQTIVTIVKTAVGVIQTIWKNFGDNLFAVIDFVWDTITGLVENALQIIQGVIQVVTGIISGDWGKAWDGIKNIFGGVWNFISSLPGIVLDAILLVIRNAIDTIITIWQAGWQIIQGGASAAWNAIQNIVLGGIGAVVGFITSIPGRIAGLASSVWNGFINGARGALDSVLGFFRNLPGNILGLAGSIGGAALSIGSTIVNKLGEGLSKVAGFVGDIAGAVGRAVKGAINAVIDLLNDGIPNSLGWGPAKIDLPDNPIPRLHSGALLPGRDESLAILQGGEAVLNRGQVGALKSLMSMLGISGRSLSLPGAGGVGDGLSVNLYFPGVTSSSEAEGIREALRDPSMLNQLTRTLKAGRR